MACLFMLVKPCLIAYEFGVGRGGMGKREMQEVEQKDKQDHCCGLKLWKFEDGKISKTTIAH
jgi:ribosomal protein L37AE/L43A